MTAAADRRARRPAAAPSGDAILAPRRTSTPTTATSTPSRASRSTVEQGEIVTLIGANGAGKTTTLKTISGLLHPRQGTVIFEGEDISRTPAHELVRAGHRPVPEGRRIFSRLTVLENLQMGAFTRDQDDDPGRTSSASSTLFPRLRERTDQLGGTLSGGEQQMLAIGRALMSRAAAAAPRRAVARPRARSSSSRSSQIDQGDQRAGHDDPARRAERAPGARRSPTAATSSRPARSSCPGRPRAAQERDGPQGVSRRGLDRSVAAQPGARPCRASHPMADRRTTVNEPIVDQTRVPPACRGPDRQRRPGAAPSAALILVFVTGAVLKPWASPAAARGPVRAPRLAPRWPPPRSSRIPSAGLRAHCRGAGGLAGVQPRDVVPRPGRPRSGAASSPRPRRRARSIRPSRCPAGRRRSRRSATAPVDRHGAPARRDARPALAAGARPPAGPRPSSRSRSSASRPPSRPSLGAPLRARRGRPIAGRRDDPAGWSIGRYVFAVRVAGLERWWAVDVSAPADARRAASPGVAPRARLRAASTDRAGQSRRMASWTSD